MSTNWRIEHHDSLPSTSDICAERARHGAPDRLMIIARQQTAGRGRAGRVWASPVGNFYASAMLRPNSIASQGGLFALMAGLSLLEALQHDPTPTVIASAAKQSIFKRPDLAVRFPPLSLKWPNDIMAGDHQTGWAKLAGILLDATIEADRIATLIIGFGANLALAPELPGRATTSLAALGRQTTPEQLAEKLTARLDHWLTAPHQTLRTTWQSHAHPIGTALTVDSGHITGIYEGIDPDGSLRLRQGTTLRIIRSGDVAVL